MEQCPRAKLQPPGTGTPAPLSCPLSLPVLLRRLARGRPLEPCVLRRRKSHQQGTPEGTSLHLLQGPPKRRVPPGQHQTPRQHRARPAPNQHRGINGALMGAQRHPQSCPELAPRFDVTRAAPTPRRAPRGPGTEGPCCGHKVAFFHTKSTLRPAQTMPPLWQEQRRGRVEGLAGPRRDPHRRAGGDRAVPKCPSAAAGLWRCAGSVTASCPLAHGTSWWQRCSATRVSPTQQVSPDSDRAPQTHPGVQEHQNWVRSPKGKPVTLGPTSPQRREGDVGTARTPQGRVWWWPWLVSGSHSACLGCGSAVTSAPDVGSALASPPRSGSTTGPGEPQGGVAPRATTEGLFQRPRAPPNQAWGTL